MAKSVHDGMSALDETFPPLEPPAPAPPPAAELQAEDTPR